MIRVCVTLVMLAVGAAVGQPVALRVATFNLADLRVEEVTDAPSQRAKALAEIIQRLRPNIILLNEVAFDASATAEAPGGVAHRFATNLLATPRAAELQGMSFVVFTAPTNTGIPSGFDLDNNGRIITAHPPPPPRGNAAKDPPISDAARDYANDCWGFGTFPGQYGMALLVDSRLEILHDRVRTFQRFPWDYMPGAMLPENPDGTPWFDEEEIKFARLSSKSHWDVPVRLPNGAVVHFLCSHPTPPVFDGPEKRNARRNHDEIRFWSDYIDGEPYIVDDKDLPGGLAWNSTFVILGDLNADPKKGDAWRDPVGTFLFANRRIGRDVAPKSDVEIAGLDAHDTATFGLRVDYVIPSRDIEVRTSGIWRTMPTGTNEFPSDHFPVWMDVVVEQPKRP